MGLGVALTENAKGLAIFAKTITMLADKKLKAFAATTNPQKAKAFYQDVLGLELLSEDDFAVQFNCNGGYLRVTTVQQLTPQSFTVLGWSVPDIYETIQQLTAKGWYLKDTAFLSRMKRAYGLHRAALK